MEHLVEFRRAQERRGLLPSTIQRRESDLRQWDAWLAGQGLTWRDGTADLIEAWLDRPPLRPGRPRASSRTRYNAVSNLASFYRWAVRYGHHATDPTVMVDRPRLRPGLPRPIADEDLVAALGGADATMRAWLVLASFAGMRCAEVAGLHREDLLEAEKLVRVMGKGQRERLVPMHPDVMPALRLAGLPRTGPVFTRPDGRPWTAGQVSRRIANYLDALGIDATAHQLRHWFGSRTYQRCRDIRVVQELLGHSSPTTTAIYTAFSRPDATSAVEGLELPDAS